VKKIIIGLLAALAMAGASQAANDQLSPYAGLKRRDIKALSADEVKGLLAGEGLGFSLVAELNGFPGPRHVLDLADRLGLQPEQRARAIAIEADMKAAAVRLGKEVVALEAELDRLFREGTVEPATIQRVSAEIGAKRSTLRAVHLQAHYLMAQVLDAEQRKHYMALRGYGGDPATPAHDPAKHKH
jgi:Spy/CpxP family protein refolding chaperone